MDATCNVQDSIHVFHLVHNMCPGFWVHIIFRFQSTSFLIFSINNKSIRLNDQSIIGNGPMADQICLSSF